MKMDGPKHSGLLQAQAGEEFPGPGLGCGLGRESTRVGRWPQTSWAAQPLLGADAFWATVRLWQQSRAQVREKAVGHVLTS
jgi:hypothetical protein